jgi:hypothetical protein
MKVGAFVITCTCYICIFFLPICRASKEKCCAKGSEVAKKCPANIRETKKFVVAKSAPGAKVCVLDDVVLRDSDLKMDSGSFVNLDQTSSIDRSRVILRKNARLEMVALYSSVTAIGLTVEEGATVKLMGFILGYYDGHRYWTHMLVRKGAKVDVGMKFQIRFYANLTAEIAAGSTLECTSAPDYVEAKFKYLKIGHNSVLTMVGFKERAKNIPWNKVTVGDNLKCKFSAPNGPDFNERSDLVFNSSNKDKFTTKWLQCSENGADGPKTSKGVLVIAVGLLLIFC